MVFCMWPFSAIRRASAEKKLKKECLDEIVASMKQEGDNIFVGVNGAVTDWPTYVGENHSIGVLPSEINEDHPCIALLADVKRRHIGYTIEFFVQEMEHGEIPGGWSSKCFSETAMRIAKMELPEGYVKKPVGYAENREYAAGHVIFVREYESIREKMKSDGMDGALTRLQERTKEWEDISMDEWERMNNERKEECPYCNGTNTHFVPTGDIGTQPDEPPCNYGCDGGRSNAMLLREFRKPVNNLSTDLNGAYVPHRHEVLEELKREGIEEPIQFFPVYIKITAGE